MSKALGVIVSIGAILVFLYGADQVKAWLRGLGGPQWSPAIDPGLTQMDQDGIQYLPYQNFDVNEMAVPIQNNYGQDAQGGS